MEKTKKEFINNQYLILSTQIVDHLLLINGDALALYLFYYRMAQEEENSTFKMSVSDTSEIIGWCENKIRKARKVLISENLIKLIIKRKDNNQIFGHFIQLDTLFTKKLIYEKDEK